MKNNIAALALVALIVVFAFPGCKDQEKQRQGQLPPTPDSSPTTTSPMNPDPGTR